MQFFSLLVLLLPFLSCSLNVFIVPHSHNDVGWLKTADEYYTELVRPQIDSYLSMLASSSTYKFSFSELYYLTRYISDNPDRVSELKHYISEGRFEIVGGGWAQNDEAVVDFEMALRNVEAGWESLHSNLGLDRVRVGFQVDPFGHSSMTAALWEKLGLEMLVIYRTHYKTLVRLK